jgi:hypothetical protein
MTPLLMPGQFYSYGADSVSMIQSLRSPVTYCILVAAQFEPYASKLPAVGHLPGLISLLMYNWITIEDCFWSPSQ